MKDKVKELLPYIIIVMVVLFIKIFVVTPIRVNGDSMYSTLLDGDIMILNKTAYYFDNPKRFDIVVVDMPNEYLIKRVIGLPGEMVEYKNNKLYVDGKIIKEPISKVVTDDFNISALGCEKIPDDCYLVLGDNRGNSLDSREFGFIKKGQIIGKTGLTILPFNRIGYKNN